MKEEEIQKSIPLEEVEDYFKKYSFTETTDILQRAAEEYRKEESQRLKEQLEHNRAVANLMNKIVGNE